MNLEEYRYKNVVVQLAGTVQNVYEDKEFGVEIMKWAIY